MRRRRRRGHFLMNSMFKSSKKVEGVVCMEYCCSDILVLICLPLKIRDLDALQRLLSCCMVAVCVFTLLFRTCTRLWRTLKSKRLAVVWHGKYVQHWPMMRRMQKTDRRPFATIVTAMCGKQFQYLVNLLPAHGDRRCSRSCWCRDEEYYN